MLPVTNWTEFVSFKSCSSVESKHSNSRITMLSYEGVSKQLGGIRTATEEGLHGMGLVSLKEVAKTPKELLILLFAHELF